MVGCGDAEGMVGEFTFGCKEVKDRGTRINEF